MIKMKDFAETRATLVGHSRSAVMVCQSMRPLEWIKNLFVFAPLFFSGQATDIQKLAATCSVFLAFSAMSSAVYLFNDINDRELDRVHPQKRFRPIASGDLSVGLAGSLVIMLAMVSIGMVIWSPSVASVVLVYGLLNVVYCLWLKHRVIVDVFSIALGFVFRVLGGGLAINVVPSEWLILATFLLS